MVEFALENNTQNHVTQLHTCHDIIQSNLTGAIPRNHTRLPEDVTALAERESNKDREFKETKNAVSKTFHTLKDLISFRFKKDLIENSDDLNNVVMNQQEQLQYDQNEFSSPFSALPLHMRQSNHTQSNVFNESNKNIIPQSTTHSNIVTGEHHSFPSELSIRSSSQPLLGFDHRESQVFLEHSERSESLANIDITDSDDGGFANHSMRAQTLHSNNSKLKYYNQPHLPMSTSVLFSNRSSPTGVSNSINSASLLNINNLYRPDYQKLQPRHPSSDQHLSHNQSTVYHQSQPSQNKLQTVQNSPPTQQIMNYQSKQGLFIPIKQPEEICIQSNKKQSNQNLTLKIAFKELHLNDVPQFSPNYEIPPKFSCSAASLEFDKNGNHSSNIDSEREIAAHSSGPNRTGLQKKLEKTSFEHILKTKESDTNFLIVDPQKKNIESGFQNFSIHRGSTVSGSISSITPPLPPISPDRNLRIIPKKLPNISKVEYGSDKYNNPGIKAPIGPSRAGCPSISVQKQTTFKKGLQYQEQSLLKRHLFGLDNDLTSTTTRSLDLESMFGGPWFGGQSVSDSETETQGLKHIRNQLEGLEHMYSEVLKMLGSRGNPNICLLNETTIKPAKKRHGSISSLPSSSVSSRPIRDRRKIDDRRKVRDIKGINKRFQRLESHVVTLARSVAHLSSEMRSQHLVMVELERLRDDLNSLRTQAARSQTIFGMKSNDPESPNLTNPKRVKKLANFFGEDPPLMRLFLKKLGYEKYADAFESERVGMIELPYLGEERLQKLGVPLGPRLRILQEAQISLCRDTTLCIV